jgi:2-dehydropantoate 2-reductase
VTGPLGEERVVVVGAGSLGSVYGGLLAEAGFDVQLYCRQPHAEAVAAAGGLRVQGFGKDRVVPLRAAWRGADVEPAEIAIVLTKMPDTAAALADLPHLPEDLRLVVSLQNGLDEDGLLPAWAGAGTVVGGVSMVGGTLSGPGVAEYTFAGPTFLGELDGSVSVRTTRLGEMLEAAGLEAVVTDRITSVEWSKLVHASPSMALTALTRRMFHEIFLAPELAEVLRQLIVEGSQVASALGVELDDWPHLLPVRTLAELPHDEALERIRTHGQRLVDLGMTQVRISMLQSVERERSLEVESIHGFLSRAAERTGVDTPATTLCYRLLAGMNRYFS